MRDIAKLSVEFSSKLGVREQPRLDGKHQSNVPGLYVVGDLADAPIIKVALNQGYDVATRLANEIRGTPPDESTYDAVIVGAGPAGIGAALALEKAGKRYVVLEKEQPFNTIQNFPKRKLIFSEPRTLSSRDNFWFEDAQKEDLVDRWQHALDERSLQIQQPEEVVNIERQGDGFVVTSQRSGPDGVQDRAHNQTYVCRRVVLAIGRRGSVRRLGVPGEDLEKVAYNLKDPEDHSGRRVLVVGGGDSAVETAVACAEAGAHVAISYRGPVFSRAKLKNQERIKAQIDAGRIEAHMGTVPKEVTESHVHLARGDERIEIPNDDVLVFIGTKLPTPFLHKIGLRMVGHMDLLRAAWITSFALLTYCFYVLKHKKQLWPFGGDHLLGFVPGALEVDLGFRQVDAGFWGTSVYALLVVVFGTRAYKKYPSPVQKKRYVSLMVFQGLFLFGIPELLAPLVIKLGTVPELFARPWKLYAIAVPWPLSIWSVIDGPGWGGIQRASTAGIWIGIGLLVAFVGVPLYVRKQGERFCSYLCGCGGLAETLGDFWRHQAPRGSTSQRSEWFGRIIFLAAIPVTALIVNDAWAFFAKDALYSTKVFAQHWYGLMVDFWLASVLGVALYPYLGNRVWCRFFCPLRAWMEVLARRFAKITIKANDKCIGCGECTRFCQMGIQVQKFAQRRVDLDNSNSACIQCGICVQVCPMEVLSLSDKRKFSADDKGRLLAPSAGL